jgi:hypothetical protein
VIKVAMEQFKRYYKWAPSTREYTILFNAYQREEHRKLPTICILDGMKIEFQKEFSTDNITGKATWTGRRIYETNNQEIMETLNRYGFPSEEI